MLRLTAITALGLYVGLITFGRDLSAEEQAKLEARRADHVSVITLAQAALHDAFVGETLRQGDYVPTLAELKARKEISPTGASPVTRTLSASSETVPGNTPVNAMVQVASYSPETAQPSPAVLSSVQSTTTAVTDPAKLAAFISTDPDQQPAHADEDMILREVTASRVNVRSGPSTANPVLGQVVRDEIVRVISPVENGWVKISVEGDGVEGYMSAQFLTEVSQ